MRRRRLILLTSALVIALFSDEALAHYCSNIWYGAARLVVKPEKDTVTVSGSAQFRVYLQNNFPYKIFSVKMSGSASGYTVTVSPSGGQNVHPGQNVSYLFTVSGSGTLQTTTMSLSVSFRTGSYGNTSWERRQDHSQSELIAASNWGATNSDQSPSQNLGTLADKYPSAALGSAAPNFGRTAIQQLIKMFGYRFCWDSYGGWRSGSSDCPSPSAEGSAWSSIEQFPQDCMRAGIELGKRKPTLGGNLDAARNAGVNAMKGGSAEHKCIGAVVGAYLWQGAADTSPFTNALTSNSVAAGCIAAAQRILGGGSTSTCASGNYYERAACGAAEGIMGNDAPVKNVLMPLAGDGNSSGDYTSLYYAYMLALVTAHRRGGATGTGPVSYYPDAGGATTACTGPADCNDNNVCTSDNCNTSTGACSNPPISGCCTTNTQCEDNNPCTTNTCNTTTHTCSFPAISGCCTANSQCEDNNVCTTNTCNLSTHACEFPAIANCCTSSSQCNDNVACTTDSCDTGTNKCVFTPTSGCCTGPADCNDSNPCTDDTCNTTDGTCANTPKAGCCRSPADCDDGDACTTDTCDTTTNTCSHPLASGCCNDNSQCNDNLVCTADTCNTSAHACAFTTISGCCTSPAECDDGTACTTDTCNSSSRCEHSPIAGCCKTDPDCADTNACTDDKCNIADGTCSNTARSGCCAFDTDCDDGDDCTLDQCDTTANSCTHTRTCADQGVSPSDAGDRGSGPGRYKGLIGGCGCAVTGGAAESAPLLLLAFLLLLARRRRG